MAQTVKNLPAMQETQVRSLGQEDPLVKGEATHPMFLPGEFHGQRSLVGCPWGCQELDMTERLTHTHTHTHTHTSYSKVSVGVGRTYILRKTSFFKLVMCGVSKGFKI